MRRGEIWWAGLGPPAGSEPGYRKPVLIVSSDDLNSSALATVLAVPITGKLPREDYPGNVRLPQRASGLPKNSVAIVNQITTLDRRILIERVGRLPDTLMHEVDEGLRLVLSL